MRLALEQQRQHYNALQILRLTTSACSSPTAASRRRRVSGTIAADSLRMFSCEGHT